MVPLAELTPLVKTFTAAEPVPMAITPAPPAALTWPLIRSPVPVPMLIAPLPEVVAAMPAPEMAVIVEAVVDSTMMAPAPLAPVLETWTPFWPVMAPPTLTWTRPPTAWALTASPRRVLTSRPVSTVTVPAPAVEAEMPPRVA